MATKEKIIERFGIDKGFADNVLPTPSALDAFRSDNTVKALEEKNNVIGSAAQDHHATPAKLEAYAKQDPLRARIVDSMNSLHQY